MKYLYRTLTFLFFLFCINSIYADNLLHYINKEGLNISHEVFSAGTRDSLNCIRQHYTDNRRWWEVTAPDTTFFIEITQLKGLIQNDFSMFYREDQLGQMSQLRRETDEYINKYTEYKYRMDSIRRDLSTKGILISSTGVRPSLDEKYDIENGQFTFILDKTIRMKETEDDIKRELLSQRERPSFNYNLFITTPLVPVELFNHFRKVRTYNRLTRKHYDAVTPFLRVTIKNKNVAMDIEENCTRIHDMLDYPKYSFYYIATLAYPDEPTISHLIVHDILLANQQSGEIVWSAQSGDHSDEVEM